MFNRRRGKGRGITVLTTLTVAGAAALLPASTASAGPDGLPAGGFPVAPEIVKGLTPPKGEPPAGSVWATHAPLNPGAYGKRFQAPVTDSNSTRVYGGSPANPADFPYVVGIETHFVWPDNNGDWWWRTAFCTGTVLSPTKVMTAAHCNVDLPLGTTRVIAGRSDLSDNSAGFVARVASTWTHQSYNYAEQAAAPGWVSPMHDVAVLTLKDPLPEEYTPVGIVEQGDQTPYAAGTDAVIAGYGVTETGIFGVLYSANVPMAGDTNCAAGYGSDFDAGSMFCAGIPNPSNPNAGVDTCNGDSGGPILVGGVQVGITSWGDRCGANYGVYTRLSSYSDLVKADLNRHGLINLDWTGDGHSDLFGRLPNGQLWLASGSGLASDGSGGFSVYSLKGTGFGSFTKLFRVTNWNGDGNPSLMARDSSGRLYQYKTDGQGNFVGSPTQIGTGWNSFSDILVTNNWIGNGLPNLMGVKPTGELVLYNSDGQGGWLNPKGTLIGTGWNSFNTILTPGSWLGDGHQSLIGRKPTGELVLYNSDGQGGWINPKGTLIGTGWHKMKFFMSPGDWSGDNLIDLIGITPEGVVRLYPTNGAGVWLNAKGIQIDTDWDVFNTVF